MLFGLITIFSFLINTTGVDKQVNDYFKNQLQDYDDFKIEFLNQPEDLSSITFLTAQFDKTKSLVSLPAELIFENGKKVKTHLSFRLQLFKNVLVANSFIEKKSELKEEYFVYKQVKVNELNGTPVYSFEELKNTFSKISLSPGNILIKEFTGSIPIIKAGDKITANVTSGGTVISLSVLAKQDGCASEIIRVITQDRTQFKARIIDSHNVSIIE